MDAQDIWLAAVHGGAVAGDPPVVAPAQGLAGTGGDQPGGGALEEQGMFDGGRDGVRYKSPYPY